MQQSERLAQSQQEGWDTTITRAPASPGDHRNSYKGHRHSHKHHHKRHRQNRGLKVALAIVVALVVLVGAGAAGAAWYMSQLNSALSLSDENKDVETALTDVMPNQAFYVLVMGTDMRENGAYAYAEGERSDVMMLVRVDPKASLVTMLSVPRDTPYQLESGEIVKLNEVYNRYGAAASVQATQSVTGVPIAHFAVIHGTGLESLVDLLGGITVDVPVAISFTNIANEDVYLEPGVQRLNGAEALALANNRAAYSNQSDYKRQETARLVVQGILNELKATPVTQLPDVVMRAAGCVSTDMDVSEIRDIFEKLGTGASTYSGTGPVAGCTNPWVNDLWLCFVDPTGWQRVMGMVDAGEDPSKVSYEGDVVTLAGAPEGAMTVTVAPQSEFQAQDAEVSEEARALKDELDAEKESEEEEQNVEATDLG